MVELELEVESFQGCLSAAVGLAQEWPEIIRLAMKLRAVTTPKMPTLQHFSPLRQ